MDLTRIAQEVLDFVKAECVTLSQDLNELEQVFQEQLRRIGSRSIELHLEKAKLGYEGSSRACSCGRNQRFVGHRAKTVATLLGSIGIRRAYYHCATCGASSLPYDEAIGLGQGQTSVGLAKVATLLGVHEPFELASRMVFELTGQRLSESTVERLTHQVGSVAAGEESSQAARIERWDAPRPDVRPHRLYVAVDGVMVDHVDGWHEAKAVTCYWDAPSGRREARYAVRFESAEAFSSYVWSLACRCGLGEAEEVVLLGDGAAWIWERVGGLLKDATHVVDWYHAVEHLWACGREVYGEGHPETAKWVERMKGLLWDGDVRGLLKRLGRERDRTRSPTKRKAITGLMTYLKNQDDRLAYDRFRARELDIGSGRVEAACKHVVGMRLKRSGMRWSHDGSQATLSLRVAWLNGWWDDVWAKHPLAA